MPQSNAFCHKIAQSKLPNGNGPGQTYYKNKPTKASHPTCYLKQPTALTPHWKRFAERVVPVAPVIQGHEGGLALLVHNLVVLGQMRR